MCITETSRWRCDSRSGSPETAHIEWMAQTLFILSLKLWNVILTMTFSLSLFRHSHRQYADPFRSGFKYLQAHSHRQMHL